MAGQLFVFSAPSGAGKSTIINALKKEIDDLGYSISHTTRKPRGAEEDGIDYHFENKQKFNKMIKEGAFVEWARIYNDYYGTSFSSLKSQTSLGLDILMDLDSQGAINIKKHFKNSVLIYLLPPSLAVLKKRLKERGTDDQSIIKMRMEKASDEIKNCKRYDYVIINDDLKRATERAKAIVMAERCRINRQAAKIRRDFNVSFG